MNKNLLEKYRGSSVLITGGLGFIGSNLAHCLAKIRDVDITIVDNLFKEQGGNLFNIVGIENQIKLHLVDIGDTSAISPLIKGVDYIFNLAGSASHVDSMIRPHNDLNINCAAQISLLETCKNFNPSVRIIYTSTRQVYGKPVYLPIDECHRIHPIDINGVNKYAAEMYHLIYQQSYGPRQQMSHNKQGFIPWFVRQAIDGQMIELFGDGKQRRDLNHVDDVVNALLLTGLSDKTEGEIFNLGHNQHVSLAEISKELIKLTGRGSVVKTPFPALQQLTEIGSCYCSYRKIEDILGWQPKIGLTEGLQSIVEFYQQNRHQYWSVDADSFSKP
jgi:UDP-glucose 4-epimerase